MAPVGTSVKAATGHLIAGAGALNAAICGLALDDGSIPATLNLEKPDPKCQWNWVTGDARRVNAHHAVAIARGMHGQQVTLTFSAASA